VKRKINLYLRFIFCSFVAIEGPCAHYLGGVHSCAKPTVLWCKSGLCPHSSHPSSPLRSHPWFTECSPTTGKKVKQHSNTLHMANYCPNFRACTLLMQVPYVPKSLPGALSNIRHLNEWSTSPEGGAVSHSAIKCCKKDFKKHKYKIQCCMLPSPGLVLCPCSIPNKVGVNQMWYSHNKEWNG